MTAANRLLRSFGLAALGLAPLLSGCGKTDARDQQAKNEALPVMAVEVVMPSRDQWPERLNATGNVQAWQEAVIGAEVGGARLVEVAVNVGDVVKKGQELARLDGEMLEAQLAQQQAAVAQAQANVAKANADAARAEQLDTTGSISQQDITQYRTSAATAAAQLKLARAQADVARLNVHYARVVAPDDGVISARTATVGTVVSPGTELFRLIRGQRLEWRAEVAGDQLAKLRPGLAVEVHRPDGSTVTGTVRQIAPTVDLNTRNGLVYVDLPNDAGLPAGLFVSGDLTLGSATALALPESAVILRDGHSYVMTVDEHNIVHQVKVTTGRRHKQSIEVAGDLPADARVVKAGGSFLGDGDLVSITPSNGGDAGAAAPLDSGRHVAGAR